MPDLLNPGEPAPEFQLTDTYGRLVSLADYGSPIYEIPQNKTLPEVIYELNAASK